MEALQPGDPARVGKYRLLGRLGSGGMGRVYLAQSPGGRQVAVKIVRPELGGDPEFRARFAREIAAARNVSGLFTAPVVDADPAAPEPWLVTAYVPGPSLAAAVEEGGPLPTPTVLALAGGLAEGLAAIHSQGVVHRDLKPSNVLLADDGPRIIDFGISRAIDSTVLTRTNLVVGSPGFMSPEQAQGREAGPPSDIFCLGAVLVFAATGQGPFGAGPAHTLLYRIVYGPPAIDELPEEVRSLAKRCLDKDPGLRPTAEQILAGLAESRTLADWAPTTAWRRAAEATAGSSPAPAAPAAGQAAGSPGTLSAATGTAPFPAGEPVAGPLPSAPRRRFGWLWLAAILPLAGAAALIVPALLSAQSPVPVIPPHLNRPAKPEAVVKEYVDAINRRDWRAAWELGGRNLGQSRGSFVRGYRYTRRDRITSMRVEHGDVVVVRITAYQTNGSVQFYLLRYRVAGGRIVAGKAWQLPSR